MTAEKTSLYSLIAAMLLASCVSLPEGRPYPVGVHVYGIDSPRGWALLLPGSSGLTILGDDHFYADRARDLNRRGLTAVLLDYKAAYKAMNIRSGYTTSGKIAVVVEKTLARLFHDDPSLEGLPGVILAWSLGGQGAIVIANDNELIRRYGFKGEILYYPSNHDDLVLDAALPVLIMIGGDDDVVSTAIIREIVERRTGTSSSVTLITYPNAYHGFDVPSLPSKKVVRLLPFMGPEATFGYNAEAASDSERRRDLFLAGIGM